MIIELNGQQFIIEVNDSSLDALNIASAQPVLLIEFDENLTKDADTEKNRELAAYWESNHLNRRPVEEARAGFGVATSVRYRTPDSQFETLDGVRKIKSIPSEDAPVFQYISNTCTLKTAFKFLNTSTEAPESPLRILVAVSSSSRDRDRSCVAIILCRDGASLMNDTCLQLHSSLGASYKKWSYYHVDNLAVMLQDLFNKHGSTCRNFLDTQGSILESVAYDYVLTAVDKSKAPAGFRFFTVMPTQVSNEFEPAVYTPKKP